MVHGLPAGTQPEDLHALLPDGAPAPVSMEGDCALERKVLLVFASPQDANQAFKQLQVTSHRGWHLQRHACNDRNLSPCTRPGFSCLI